MLNNVAKRNKAKTKRLAQTYHKDICKNKNCLTTLPQDFSDFAVNPTLTEPVTDDWDNRKLHSYDTFPFFSSRPWLRKGR
jgi:hypothetical protein